MIEIGDRKIDRVLIVDDNPEARVSHGFLIEDMDLIPHKVKNIHNGNLQNFFNSIRSTDAILCDFQLKNRSYAPHNGDRIVSQCFRRGILGALCTNIAGASIRRDYLRYIPGLLRKGNPCPDELLRAWKNCMDELIGEPRPSRRPWRTLVRVGDVDDEHKCFYAVIPAWDTQIKVRIDFDNLPENIVGLVRPDHRFHAQVNTGAMDPADLYFDGWEEK